jgi:uncharacterized membrane protein YfcA
MLTLAHGSALIALRKHMDDGTWLLLWIIIGAIVGGAIGSRRNQAFASAVLAALLGPIGWIVVLCSDNRPKCPEREEPINEGAARCPNCGYSIRRNIQELVEAGAFKESETRHEKG